MNVEAVGVSKSMCLDTIKRENIGLVPVGPQENTKRNNKHNYYEL